MLNLDTIQTARRIEEQAYPARLERARKISEARDGMPRAHPEPIVKLGRLVARAGIWLQGYPQLPRPEAICEECQQPLSGTLA